MAVRLVGAPGGLSSSITVTVTVLLVSPVPLSVSVTCSSFLSPSWTALMSKTCSTAQFADVKVSDEGVP